MFVSQLNLEFPFSGAAVSLDEQEGEAARDDHEMQIEDVIRWWMVSLKVDHEEAERRS